MKQTTYVCDFCGVAVPPGTGWAHYFTESASELTAPHAQPFWDAQRDKYRVRTHEPADGLIAWTIVIDVCHASECADAAESAIMELHEAHRGFMARGLARVIGAGGATPDFFRAAAAAARAGSLDNTGMELAAATARASDNKAGGQ